MINDASSSRKFSENYFSYLKILIDELSIENISKFIELILQTRENDKTIYFIGNGGSASTASHFVNDISLGSRQFEKPFRAISLCDNQAVITAIGNDDGYENIFLQNFLLSLKSVLAYFLRLQNQIYYFLCNSKFNTALAVVFDF